MRTASRRPRGTFLTVVAAALGLAGAGLAGPVAPAAQASTGPQMLRVGSYNGIAGSYTSIRAALAAARPAARDRLKAA